MGPGLRSSGARRISAAQQRLCQSAKSMPCWTNCAPRAAPRRPTSISRNCTWAKWASPNRLATNSAGSVPHIDSRSGATLTLPGGFFPSAATSAGSERVVTCRCRRSGRSSGSSPARRNISLRQSRASENHRWTAALEYRSISPTSSSEKSYSPTRVMISAWSSLSRARQSSTSRANTTCSSKLGML